MKFTSASKLDRKSGVRWANRLMYVGGTRPGVDAGPHPLRSLQPYKFALDSFDDHGLEGHRLVWLVL
jgi:hypothetical protein